MQSIKKSVAQVFAGLTASFVFSSASWADVSVVVNREQPLPVQQTTGGSSGISYQQTDGATSALQVYADGFLFCQNIDPAGNNHVDQVTLIPRHQDQSFSPAHEWTFPTTVDVRRVAFTGSTVAVNGSLDNTTLTCHAVGRNGEMAHSLTDGVFRNGVESATDTNYANLINWLTPANFDWGSADFANVPQNPCDPDANQPALIDETASCAAVTGVRYSNDAARRSATIWTATDGISFTYLFRVDNRFGPQVIGGPTAKVPDPSAAQSPDDSVSSIVKIVDAYDSTFLGDGGDYCILTQPPSVLNSSVCANSTTFPLDGPLTLQHTAFPPPLDNGTVFFYIAVNRTVQGGHPNLTTPVVAASVVVDPALLSEGGDRFRGDDVTFGFMPTSSGFPWMTATP